MTTTIGAIVLAAGFSTRFGGPKLLARLDDGHTVAARTLQHIGAAGLPSIVITRPEIAPQLQLGDAASTRLVSFEGASNGMGASLAFGVSQARQWDGCLVCLADMPFIRSDTYRAIADQVTPASIVIPHYGAAAGHPVAFGRDFFPALLALDGDAGGRSLIQQYPHAVVELRIDDPAILQDIDTPEDLSRLQPAP